MWVRGQQHHYWPLTANRMNFCAAPVHSKLFWPAIAEVKGRAPANIAAWPVVDRGNCTINSVYVTASKTGDPRAGP